MLNLASTEIKSPNEKDEKKKLFTKQPNNYFNTKDSAKRSDI